MQDNLEDMYEEPKLNVHSIFESISGEAGGFPQGTWTTFIRFFGCNLRCNWCDTKQAYDNKTEEGLGFMTPSEILSKVTNKHVLITGGEPLYQKENVIHLIMHLLCKGCKVQVETNGSIELPLYSFNEPVEWVMDYKCPSSGMSKFMLPPQLLSRNIEKCRKLGGHVYTKWVVADGDDLDFAIDHITQLRECGYYGQHIISPIDAKGDMIKGIVEILKVHHPEILEDIIFSVQMHKVINMP